MSAMDEFNNRFGRDAVRIGSAMPASRGSDVRVWATRQDSRSPRITTRWTEMPVAGLSMGPRSPTRMPRVVPEPTFRHSLSEQCRLSCTKRALGWGPVVNTRFDCRPGSVT